MFEKRTSLTPDRRRGRNRLIASIVVAGAVGGWALIHSPRALADSTYFNLTLGSFTQDWSNTGLITANDNWSGVPSIVGYLGDYTAGSPTGVDPQTIVASAPTAADVNANQTNPNTFTTGGVAEFQIANPTIALNGSGTADAPNIQLHLNSAGRKDVTVSYNLRDLDGSADNSVQQVALQFRPMASSNWINVPAGYVADATTGPSVATLVTPVQVTLPADANNQPTLEIRIITTNAGGNDEWVGIDDIVVSSIDCAGPCPVPPPPTITEIHDIQGPGRISPYNNQIVTTQGVVTARARNGYYLQGVTPDADPLTSEGIFVFTNSTPGVAIGDQIKVSGRVSEFSNLSEAAPTLTELVDTVVLQTLATGSSLPDPAPIAADLAAGVAFDSLERYEGMRVSVPATVVVAPSGERSTNPDGQFFVTPTGVPRPFREPGLEANTQLALNEPPTAAPAAPTVPRFDSNAEALRVDTDELFALDNVRTPGITAAVGALVAPFTAVLHFEDRSYNALPIVNVASAVQSLLSNNVLQPVAAVPLPSSSQFTIASANLEFFSSSDTNRLSKFVRAMCDVLRAPDILGMIEIDSLTSLTAIANGANAYGGGCADSTYAAFLSDPDTATQNTGFLVKTTKDSTTRVTVLSTQRTRTVEGGLDADAVFLTGDRRPYLLRATVSANGATGLPVTVILHHPKSLIESDVPVGSPDRQKRLNHALYAANLVKRLQTEDPNVKLALIGDLNAFEFNDGIVDVLGILRGNPVPDDETYLAGDSIDVFGTPSVEDLINLTGSLAPSERYSYSFRGDSQVLDHHLVNPSLLTRFAKYAIAHVNSVYPAFDPVSGQRLRDVTTRPERYSDHDVPVSFFEMDTIAPTASPTQAPAANGAGWNNTDVTVQWNWTDNAGGSGIDSGNCTTSSVSSGEGAAVALNATCKDLEGNTGNASYTVKVDKTKPVISIASPLTGKSYPIATLLPITWTAVDPVSGVATQSGTLDGSTALTNGGSVNLLFLAPGSHTVVVNATDAAGNMNSASSIFSVIVTAGSLSSAIDQLLAMDAISNAGVANSLQAKLKGTPSRNNLNAFLNELNAQLGKKINQQAYNILKAGALALLATLP